MTIIIQLSIKSQIMKQYSFLSKIQSQVDLQDIWNILQEPILVLENLEEQIKNQQLQKKMKIDNLELQFQIEQLIHKDFPALIDSYCELSFDYRNHHVLKKEKQGSEIISLTAKKILIKNVSILIEKVYQLEQEFNEIHKNHLLVRDKINSNFETEKEPIYHLENEFDYQKYQENKKQEQKSSVKPNTLFQNEDDNLTTDYEDLNETTIQAQKFQWKSFSYKIFQYFFDLSIFLFVCLLIIFILK